MRQALATPTDQPDRIAFVSHGRKTAAMQCPQCATDMQKGRAWVRPEVRFLVVPLRPTPNCWFRATDGSVEAAVVPGHMRPDAFRCQNCKTIVVIGC